MALELSKTNEIYEDISVAVFKHFINIAWAMHHKKIYRFGMIRRILYDVVEMSDGSTERLKVRSLVGVIPMFAEIMHVDLFKELKEFQKQTNEIIRTRPDLASLISNIENSNSDGNFLFLCVGLV
jgi:hypothetical protein